MRIAIASDLHIEFGPKDFELRSEPADVLILAGDIGTPNRDSERQRGYVEFFEDCASRFKHVVYVFGNHEFFYGDLVSTADIVNERLGHIDNLHVLWDDKIIIDGVIFVGTTLWTYPDPLEEIGLLKRMYDYRCIRDAGEPFTITSLKLLNEAQLGWLKENIGLASVVVTHHLPSYRCIAPEYADSPINSGFANRLDDLILDNPHIELWCYGHSHATNDLMIGNTRLVSNPRGYYGAETNSRTFDTKIVEIP
jgi:DNA repair exonuclease SbcCD nuclease subunit